MFKILYNNFIELNSKVKNLVKYGFYFSACILLISMLILFTYEFFYTTPILYYTGINTFKLSATYFVTFLCFGFAFNKILNEI